MQFEVLDPSLLNSRIRSCIWDTISVCLSLVLPGISVTAPWALNWFSDENGNKVVIQIIALGVYLESISIDADMAIQGSINIPSVHTVTVLLSFNLSHYRTWKTNSQCVAFNKRV